MPLSKDEIIKIAIAKAKTNKQPKLEKTIAEKFNAALYDLRYYNNMLLKGGWDEINIAFITQKRDEALALSKSLQETDEYKEWLASS